MEAGSGSALLIFVIEIAGSAALLIWAVRLVRTGVERAFAVQLRTFLRRSVENRWQAGLSGIATAICLQSATAVAVLVSNFSARGGIGVATGLAILLGADIGSAIVTQIMFLRVDILTPVFLLLGVSFFLRGGRPVTRQSGRILIGIALIFVSLGMIRAATAPLVQSSGTISAVQFLGSDVMTSFVIGAVFAWLVHSSVAAVLFFVTLAAQGLLPVTGAAAMVLGANAGGAVIAFTLTMSAAAGARRIVMANLLLRGGGAILIAMALPLLAQHLGWLGGSAARQTINLHLIFNVVILIVGFPMLSAIGRMSEIIIPDDSDGLTHLRRKSALDPAALSEPDRALNCVAREIMQMGEYAETVLRSVIDLFRQWDEPTAKLLTDHARSVQDMHEGIKLYIARLDESVAQHSDTPTTEELASNARNIEAAATSVSRDLLAHARTLKERGLVMSEDGRKEIEDFHDRVLANAQLALGVLMTRAPDAARQVVAEKEKVRRVERDLQDRHLDRLREGRPESLETSRIHQDTLRSLKEINAFFATIAQPIAQRSGDLLDSRLSTASDS